MSEWKEIEFSKLLVDESISYGIVQPGAHSEINSVPIIRVNNIKNGYIKTDDVLKVDASIEDKYKRTRLNGGELLITVVGSVGECAIVPDNLKGWNVARAVSVAKIKSDFDTRFIKYAFKTDDIIFQMYGNTNDTVQPTLNLASLKALKFQIPTFPEQTAIASVLSSLDDKIDLLHRQNATLEKMAETLFRQWFVEEAKEEWENCNLEDLCSQINSGGTPSTKIESYYNGNINWYSTKELNDNYLFESISKITQDGLDNSSAKLFPKGTVLIAIYAAPTVGRLGILGNQASFNQAACGLVANDKFCCKEFIYLFLKSQRDELNAMASGSAQQNLNVGKIKSYPAFIPDEMTMTKFKNEVVPLFNKIEKNSIQIRTLTTLRDTLLPKLMSGEVKVEI